MRVGSLFAGIGGFDLGLERAGLEIAWQVEIDPYCQRVLAKHWPNVPRYGDIKSIDWGALPAVDLICGGFPCQPFSLAGQRRGTADDRYLWPAMLSGIQQLQPTWIIGENVPGLVGPVLDTVLSDLEAAGYEVQTLAIPACAFDASHIRQRLWILAYHSEHGRRQGRKRGFDSGCERKSEQAFQAVPHGHAARQLQSQGCQPEQWKRTGDSHSGNVANSNGEPMERPAEPWSERHLWRAQPAVGELVHGLPGELVPFNGPTVRRCKGREEMLRGLGNAIVPQIAEWIGRQIMKVSHG